MRKYMLSMKRFRSCIIPCQRKISSITNNVGVLCLPVCLDTRKVHSLPFEQILFSPVEFDEVEVTGALRGAL